MTPSAPGAPEPAPAAGVPAGVRTVSPVPDGATRVVLVRHGEAVCNVEGVVGGEVGCTGLTATGVAQATALAERVRHSGELGGVEAVYASVLARAIETAEILAPALEPWRDGPPLTVVRDADLSELRPGEADGLTWGEFSERYPEPDWDRDPDQPVAPGGESWSGFVRRAAGAVERLAEVHRGGHVVAVCHAGVIEATMLRFLPVDAGVARLGLRTTHASLTVWERAGGRWLLLRYNDVGVPSVQQA